MLKWLGELLAGLGQQGSEHFITLGVERLPLNTRETGMFAGVALVLALLALSGRLSGRKAAPAGIRLSVLAVGLLGLIDGVQAVAGDPLYATTQATRYVSGLAMGGAFAATLLPYWNLLLRDHPSADAPLEDAGEVLGAVIAIGLAAYVLYLLTALTLWPLALVSLVGLGSIAFACGTLALLPVRRHLSRWYELSAIVVGLAGTVLLGRG